MDIISPPIAATVIETPRLILRPLTVADAPDVRRLAGTYEVASTTLAVPHPYPEGAAESWIATHPASLARGEFVVFGVMLRETSELTGAIGLTLALSQCRAEMGYWLGHEYWGRGIATESATAILKYGFETLRLHRIYATHFRRNPASGRVMQKIGMRHEGTLRGWVLKWGEFEDCELYAKLREDDRLDLDTR